MDCQELNNQIYDYCDDSTPPQTYLRISKHLKDCPSCQRLYQLTRLENEVLRDTTDIPSLPPDFTSRVMISIGPVLRGPGLLYNQKFWYGGLAAVAVVALFLFMPQLLQDPGYIKMADNAAVSPEAAAPFGMPVPTDGEMTEDTAHKPDMAKEPQPAVVSTNDRTYTDSGRPSMPSPPAVLSTKRAPADQSIPGQGFSGQVSIPSQAETVQDTAATVPETLPASPAVNQAVSPLAEDYGPAITPLNIPPGLQLKKVDISADNRTVYDYVTQDGTVTIQIMVDPYIAPDIKLPVLAKTLPEGMNSLVRWVLVDDKMLTVTYAGNIPLEQLTHLANSVRFK